MNPLIITIVRTITTVSSIAVNPGSVDDSVISGLREKLSDTDIQCILIIDPDKCTVEKIERGS